MSSPNRQNCQWHAVRMVSMDQELIQLVIGDSAVPLCSGVEMLRALSGAGINTRDNPTNLIDYVPIEGEAGGLFDRGRSKKKKKTGQHGGFARHFSFKRS